jgi:hypothetical protein
VSGQVLDPLGHPVGNAWLVLQDLDGWSLSADWETRSDATGHFEILSVAPGTYTALARKDTSEASSAPVRVEAGKTASVKIVLP